jgi:hypothetical protein
VAYVALVPVGRALHVLELFAVLHCLSNYHQSEKNILMSSASLFVIEYLHEAAGSLAVLEQYLV